MTKAFDITPTMGKCSIETFNFTNDEGQRLSIATLWKDVSIVIVIEDDDEIPEWETLERLEVSDLTYYVDYTYDGVSEDLYSDDLDEEELEELKEVWQEDGHAGIEDAGWNEEDPSFVIDCKVNAVEITDPERLAYYV